MQASRKVGYWNAGAMTELAILQQMTSNLLHNQPEQPFIRVTPWRTVLMAALHSVQRYLHAHGVVQKDIFRKAWKFGDKTENVEDNLQDDDLFAFAILKAIPFREITEVDVANRFHVHVGMAFSDISTNRLVCINRIRHAFSRLEMFHLGSIHVKADASWSFRRMAWHAMPVTARQACLEHAVATTLHGSHLGPIQHIMNVLTPPMQLNVAPPPARAIRASPGTLAVPPTPGACLSEVAVCLNPHRPKGFMDLPPRVRGPASSAGSVGDPLGITSARSSGGGPDMQHEESRASASAADSRVKREDPDPAVGGTASQRLGSMAPRDDVAQREAPEETAPLHDSMCSIRKKPEWLSEFQYEILRMHVQATRRVPTVPEAYKMLAARGCSLNPKAVPKRALSNMLAYWKGSSAAGRATAAVAGGAKSIAPASLAGPPMRAAPAQRGVPAPASEAMAVPARRPASEAMVAPARRRWPQPLAPAERGTGTPSPDQTSETTPQARPAAPIAQALAPAAVAPSAPHVVPAAAAPNAPPVAPAPSSGQLRAAAADEQRLCRPGWMTDDQHAELLRHWRQRQEVPTAAEFKELVAARGQPVSVTIPARTVTDYFTYLRRKWRRSGASETAAAGRPSTRRSAAKAHASSLLPRTPQDAAICCEP